MEKVRYFDRELTIYLNGRCLSTERLDIKRLYDLNGNKVKVCTKNKDIIGFLNIHEFETYEPIQEITLITGKENNNYVYTNIKFDEIVDVECILFSTCKYQRNVTFDFEPENEVNEFSKWIVDNNINLDCSLKYHIIHQGNFIDAYARGKNSKPYICSCYKQSIINLIKLYERYIQYDCVIENRNELLLNLLGLPKYYENIIKDSKTDWSMKWIDMLNFKDNLCPYCNEVRFTPIKSLNIYSTEFKETYKKERRKRELSNGIYYMRGDFMPYVLSDLLSDKYKGYFDLTDEEIKEILRTEYKISEDEINKNFIVLNTYDESIKHDYLLSSNYLNKQEYKDILKNIEVSENFDNAIYDLYKKRNSLFKKEITSELKELAKPKPKNLVLKIREYNWGLRTFDEWDNTIWEIYEDMSILIRVTYGKDTDEIESVFTKRTFDKIMKNIEKAKNVDVTVDGCDGSAWEFIQYQNGNEIWHFELGYIYGNDALENIVKELNLYM